MTEPTKVEMPWPTLHAGQRLATSAFTRSAMADYGDARANERDAYWIKEISELTAALKATGFPIND